MNKIVFSNLPMKKDLYKMHYTVEGNKTIEYNGEVAFPINAVLAKAMKKCDNVKVVLLAKDDADGNSAVNVDMFQKELDGINSEIGANIEYVIIKTPFVETKDIHDQLLKDMINELSENAEIIGDITYGPKPLPIIMFAVMNFAEKFFHCDVKNIIYGKVEFRNDNLAPINPVIYDMTPLYYINSLTNTMEYNSSDEAVKALNLLLDF